MKWSFFFVFLFFPPVFMGMCTHCGFQSLEVLGQGTKGESSEQHCPGAILGTTWEELETLLKNVLSPVIIHCNERGTKGCEGEW
jgi:hypothetical protein